PDALPICPPTWPRTRPPSPVAVSSMRPLTRLPEAEARLAIAFVWVPMAAISRGSGGGGGCSVAVRGPDAQAPSSSADIAGSTSDGIRTDGTRGNLDMGNDDDAAGRVDAMSCRRGRSSVAGIARRAKADWRSAFGGWAGNGNGKRNQVEAKD